MPDSEKRGWSLLWEASRGVRSSVTVGVGAGIIWTAARVVIPILTGDAVDQGILGGRSSALVLYSLIIVGLGLLSAGCSGVRRYLAFKVAYSVETTLREEMFANLQRLDFRFHDQAQTGQLMARSATDLQQINGLITMVPITVANFMTLGAVSVILLVIDVRLGLISLACLPLVSLAAKRFSTRLHPVAMATQQQLSVLSGMVEESVTGIRAVKGIGAEPALVEAMRRQTQRVFDLVMRLSIIRGNFNPVLDVLPSVALGVMLWYGGLQVIHGHLSVGQLLAFNVYVVMLVGPLRMLGQTIAQAQRAIASAERVTEILDALPDVTEPSHPRPLPPGRGRLDFDSVSFAYAPAGPRRLDGFDLRVAAGESVALVGSTGSGKTTVARLVPRFYDVTDGSVSIDGADVRTVRIRDLRRAVSVVFEDTFLFTGSIAENIAFPDPDAPPDDVRRAARLAGATEFIEALPDGYETLVGERGLSLSGGQRQRLALARAIIAEPRVLILDDATSSVDASKEHEIRAALASVMEGRTTLVISHRPATISLASRVVLLDEGQIVAEGTHDSLLAGCVRYGEILAQGRALDAARAEMRPGEVDVR